jgi:enamine deaminase RidA (YjgF/YER057c/UK114 family)
MTITRLEAGKRMSQAVKHGNTVYLAGQVAQDYNGTIEKQTGEVLAAIDKLLAAAGTSKSKVLSCQVILNNIADFAAMNTVYDAWIDPANPPARACIEARLAHPSLKVEIIAVAALD